MRIKMMQSHRLFLFILLLLFCKVNFAQKKDTWLGHLQLNDSISLPVYFDVDVKGNTMVFDFQNDQEHIRATEVSTTGDSVFIKLPVFDSELRLKQTQDHFSGTYVNHARQDHNVLVFEASKVLSKNTLSAPTRFLHGESWQVHFSPNTPDAYPAIGLFSMDPQSGRLHGTFLTETGDYRYLSGKAEPAGKGFKLTLGCFDGSHAFLFTALLDTSKASMRGEFYSGAHGHESWEAQQDSAFSLRDPDSLTALKPGFTGLEFTFKNLQGDPVSLKDKRYKDKVVIVQIMGSWCPNCMDETRYFAELNRRYKARGLEVIALAFERGTDLAQQRKNLLRVKQQLGADYEFLLTGYAGKAAEASKALPMLNRVMAFPTAIYIDRKGRCATYQRASMVLLQALTTRLGWRRRTC